jgi:hypothetical protein
MGTYAIIGLMDRDRNVGMWRLDTSAGGIVMIFSDMRTFAEVATYAERHGKGPGHKIAEITFTEDSPARARANAEEIGRISGTPSMNYVVEGEKMFDDLLAIIREQNATDG